MKVISEKYCKGSSALKVTKYQELASTSSSVLSSRFSTAVLGLLHFMDAL